MPMMSEELRITLQEVARFYDGRKVGDGGSLGFRRSSDLSRLVSCLEQLINQHILVPRRSLFLDMGCADGRVNVLFSYVVGKSIGTELHEWILDEFVPLKRELEGTLNEHKLTLPPDNISLFHGDALDGAVHEAIYEETGVGFGEFDLFYTYLTMYGEFADLIGRKAKRGSVFMVYGLDKVLPRLEGFRLLTPERPMEGILALYQKI